MESGMKEKILKQLLLKPRNLMKAENIGGDKSGLYGDGKGVWGIAQTGLCGDITDITGDVSGIGPGDISQFVGSMTGIKASAPEIIWVLEKAGKIIKQKSPA